MIHLSLFTTISVNSLSNYHNLISVQLKGEIPKLKKDYVTYGSFKNFDFCFKNLLCSASFLLISCRKPLFINGAGCVIYLLFFSHEKVTRENWKWRRKELCTDLHLKKMLVNEETGTIFTNLHKYRRKKPPWASICDKYGIILQSLALIFHSHSLMTISIEIHTVGKM
jgi:hypothetical protein